MARASGTLEEAVRAAALVFLLLSLAGCLSPLTRKAKSLLTLPSGAIVTQDGAVDVPAHVETKDSALSFTIPKDSKFSFDQALGQLSLTFSRDVPATSTTREEHGTAAKPVAPVSAIDISRAETLSKFYWVALGLGLLAAFLFYEAHIKAGLVAAGGAIAVPILAKYFSSDAAQYGATIAVCIAGSLFIAWHFCKDRIQTSFVSAVSDVKTVIQKAEKSVS